MKLNFFFKYSAKSGPRATARPATHHIRTARDELDGPRAGLKIEMNIVQIGCFN